MEAFVIKKDEYCIKKGFIYNGEGKKNCREFHKKASNCGLTWSSCECFALLLWLLLLVWYFGFHFIFALSHCFDFGFLFLFKKKQKKFGLQVFSLLLGLPTDGIIKKTEKMSKLQFVYNLFNVFDRRIRGKARVGSQTLPPNDENHKISDNFTNIQEIKQIRPSSTLKIDTFSKKTLRKSPKNLKISPFSLYQMLSARNSVFIV